MRYKLHFFDKNIPKPRRSEYRERTKLAAQKVAEQLLKEARSAYKKADLHNTRAQSVAPTAQVSQALPASEDANQDGVPSPLCEKADHHKENYTLPEPEVKASASTRAPVNDDNFNMLDAEHSNLETSYTLGDETQGKHRIPICPCAVPTEEEVVVMVLALGIRHNWTWVEQVNVLKLINALYKTPVVPETKYKYFQLVDYSNDKLQYYICCPQCNKFHGNRDKLPKSVDCKCGNTFKIKEASYFLGVDIKSQITDLLESSTQLANSILTYRFERESSCNELQDIYDGFQYRKHFVNGGPLSNPYNFSFIFNTDGVPLGKSSSKTIWPIYITLNELPPHLRSKHTLLAGLYVGPKDPDQNVFLQPFVEQANTLAKEGFAWRHEGKEVVSKLLPLCAVVDSVARWQMLNMSAVNSYFACTMCYQKAEHTPKGQRFPPSVDQAVAQRTGETIREDMERAYSLRYEKDPKNRIVKGVKGPSPLLWLAYFDLGTSVPVDYMHCLMQGVVRLHTELIFETSRKKFWQDLDESVGVEHIKTAVDERLLKICPPNSITRSVRSLNQVKYWKASEFRSWGVMYAIPCLTGLLKEKHLKHFALLSKATNTLLQKSVQIDEVQEAHELFLEYIFYFNKYFKTVEVVLNVHLLGHIAQCVLNWGPLWTHNAFPFEGRNRHLLQQLHSPNHVTKQLARKYVTITRFPALCEEIISSQEVFAFCEDTLDMHLKRFVRCNGAVLLGAREKLELSINEKKCIENCSVFADDTFNFKRMIYKGMRFSTELSSISKKHNNSYVLLTNDMVCVIKYILEVRKEKVYVLVEEMLVTEMRVADIKNFHIKSISSTGRLHCVPVDNVTDQCVLIDTGLQKYIAKMPFGCYKD